MASPSPNYQKQMGVLMACIPGQARVFRFHPANHQARGPFLVGLLCFGDVSFASKWLACSWLLKRSTFSPERASIVVRKLLDCGNICLPTMNGPRSGTGNPRTIICTGVCFWGRLLGSACICKALSTEMGVHRLQKPTFLDRLVHFHVWEGHGFRVSAKRHRNPSVSSKLGLLCQSGRMGQTSGTPLLYPPQLTSISGLFFHAQVFVISISPVGSKFFPNS